MHILALDATAVTASVAIVCDDHTRALMSADNGLTHSEHLLPMVNAVLDTSGLSIESLDLLACTAGPGSFTGVRIGVATLKGLAFGRDLPCVGVSTTEALAEGLAPLGGILIGVMDARRAQVYCGVFTIRDGTLVRLAEDRAMALSDLVSEVMGAYPDAPVWLAGDAYQMAYDAFSSAGCTCLAETPKELRAPNAAAIARCALRKHLAGLSVRDTDLHPVYLRLPQAERELIEKEKKKEHDTNETA